MVPEEISGEEPRYMNKPPVLTPILKAPFARKLLMLWLATSVSPWKQLFQHLVTPCSNAKTKRHYIYVQPLNKLAAFTSTGRGGVIN